MNRKSNRYKAHRIFQAWQVEGIVTCVYCGLALELTEPNQPKRADNNLTLDRIKPGFDEGTYALSNLVPACSKCNERRGHMNFHDFCDLMCVDSGGILYRKAVALLHLQSIHSGFN